MREKGEIKARNLREDVDTLKRKVEVVRKEIIVRAKKRAGGDSSGNEMEQVRLNNVIARSEEGIG